MCFLSPLSSSRTLISFLPCVTFVVSLSPAALLAVISRLVEAMLAREQDSPAVVHSWTFGATLLSYTVYMVANTDAFHETVTKELLPV